MHQIKFIFLESRCLLAANSTQMEEPSVFLDDGQWINGYNGVWNLVEHYSQFIPDTPVAKVMRLARPIGEIFLMHPHHTAGEKAIVEAEAKLNAAENFSEIQKVLTEEKLANAKAGKFITDGWTTFDVLAIASTASTFVTNAVAPYITGPLTMLAPYLFSKSAWSASNNAVEHWTNWVTACNAVVDNADTESGRSINEFHELVAKNQQPFFHTFLAGQALGKTIATAAGPIVWTVGKLFSKSSNAPLEAVRALPGQEENPQADGGNAQPDAANAQAPAEAPIALAKQMSWNAMVMTVSAFVQVGTHWVENYFNPETPLTEGERTTIHTFLEGLKNETPSGAGGYMSALNQYAQNGAYLNSFIPATHAELLKTAGATDDGVELFCSALNIRGC